MSAIKQYIWDQAETLANEFGLRTDNVADEIFAYLEKGYPTDEAIATVRMNIATAPLKKFVFKECSIQIGDPIAPTATKIRQTLIDGYGGPFKGENFVNLTIGDIEKQPTIREIGDEIWRSMQGGK